MSYWVYENLPRRKTRVHLGSCSFCQNGKGIHGGGETATGSWSGPYDSVDDASIFAISRQQPDHRNCYECLPGAGEEIDAPIALPSVEQPSVQMCVWDSIDEHKAALRLRWRPIGRLVLDERGKPRFPNAEQTPGLYRIRMRSSSGSESVYIGESDNLRRRFGNYRNPGPSQQTSLRLNGVLRSWLESGGEISVAIADEATLTAGTEELKADLSKKSVRMLFENFAISADNAEHVEALNR